MMRDIGYNWTWMDKYSPNLLARGFEYQNKEKCELVTAFEVFEHFAEPGKEVEALFKFSDNILFSTMLYDKELSCKGFSEWWYYVPEEGQHIAFYSERTCRYIAAEYGVNYYRLCDDLHLFTPKHLSKKFIKVFFPDHCRWMIQYYYYHKNLKYNKCTADMEKMIKLMKAQYDT
ncbi:MAG: class I SAM-dependent methyltransferase [Blautia sp.]|nr:class I SAM-dependent methyltransferase [Blautia sp.]MCM1201832.1 class I SAM-dependent methyltransferase [Bacteroides fragilis]